MLTHTYRYAHLRMRAGVKTPIGVRDSTSSWSWSDRFYVLPDVSAGNKTWFPCKDRMCY